MKNADLRRIRIGSLRHESMKNIEKHIARLNDDYSAFFYEYCASEQIGQRITLNECFVEPKLVQMQRLKNDKLQKMQWTEAAEIDGMAGLMEILCAGSKSAILIEV